MLSIFDRGTATPCPCHLNLAQYVLTQADVSPDKPALEVLGAQSTEVWTRAEFSRAVRGLAAGLLDEGFTPGDILLMRLGNTVDFPIAFLAAIWAGLIPVPTSGQLSEPEVQGIIADLGPAAILHEPDLSCPAHPRILTTETLRRLQTATPHAQHNSGRDDLAYIVYTSGTSGRPRAVAHAHRAIWARRMMIRDWYDLRPDDRMMHAGAFNWTFTLGTGLMDPLTVGATALVPKAGTQPGDLARLLDRSEATIFAGVPGIYRHILKQEAALAFPRLRHCLSAGEKLSPALHAAWRDRTGREIYEAFGMSECSTFISAAPHLPSAGSSLGQPQTGRRVAILGDDGPAPLNDPGVIAVHRTDPGLMIGYFGAPEATRARMQGEWFLTGDRGSMDADGQVTYLGRADDMMNAGGYRVSPLEVEAAMATCPHLTQFAVTAIEVKPDVQIIVGFYSGSKELTAEVLRDFAKSRLADYKQPKTYQRVEALPLGPNGKLRRRALPALYEGHRT
ncbi:Long-chain-fatty-acid--CoA ligase [Tritonibacter multivorans]|uniref:Long-chain-fatty-acid--CoA ligase n=1 Tax=Tritonibacter multivorans TaxID=928856 RepID=A0A0P1GJJ7_9RHOB|nr:class I adenylate-forming enzyme family protein [Tritonibacter multivorans]MDA7421527.1 class I adenylate-forming enzyme family protein [Tritonibacter multivorans]CUH82240.1 Long-chain-fatty-acid--CoA ligase [Tritonibacter multivorans]SFC96736.1 Acyl-CoA synthetase (AMP-forming)/AMP-acid ligase II [Tritonibacter multivorans]